MNSGCRAVGVDDGHKGKVVGDLSGSSKLKLENHSIGTEQKCSKRHLYLDLNGPAQQDEHEHEHEPAYEAPAILVPAVNNAPAIPVRVVNNGPAPRPVEELPGRNLEQAFDGPIDWASLNIGPDGKFTFYKPQPMTEAERNESEWRIALNSAVYEAQERDEAYYQGRLANLDIECGLSLEDQDLDLDANFEENS